MGESVEGVGGGWYDGTVGQGNGFRKDQRQERRERDLKTVTSDKSQVTSDEWERALGGRLKGWS